METRRSLCSTALTLLVFAFAPASSLAAPPKDVAALASSAAFGDAEALRSLTQAATSGNPVAQNELGMLYGNGLGVTQDVKKAAHWVGRAARSGLAEAQFNLAQMYYGEGNGVKQDYKLAATWYGKAAAQDHPSALYNLAGMHMNGEGVAKNAAEGRRLTERAATLGHAGAKQALDPSATASSGPTVYREVPSPMDALSRCDKGCVVFVGGRWVCVTMAETRSPPYSGHGTICTSR